MIRLNNISVQYKNGENIIEALSDVNMEIRTEFLGVVGPSGCGKSTLLRVLAGLLTPTTGCVESSTDGNGDISYGIVFQDYSLLPWLTVRQNIELALRIQKVSEEERATISTRLLAQMDLIDAKDLLPHQLSGGMRQRVAVARAFAQAPSLLLMDEPFGALDAITREELQQTLSSMYEFEPHTIVFVTHDVEEALFLCDQIVVLSNRPGRIIQTIQIPFHRPREHNLKWTSGFLNLRRKIEKLLRPRIPQRKKDYDDHTTNEHR